MSGAPAQNGAILAVPERMENRRECSDGKLFHNVANRRDWRTISPSHRSLGQKGNAGSMSANSKLCRRNMAGVKMKDATKHTQLNEAKWDKWAKSFDSDGWVQKYLRNDQRMVVSVLDVKENFHFLDVGCGTGWAVGEAAKLVSNRGQFYGVDLSPKMIEKAKTNFGANENFHFIKANAESIPLDSDFFDVIICTNSFHHYLHPDQALNEFYRLLKKGGKVFLVDANCDIWLGKIINKIFQLLEAEHVKHYTTKEFQQLFHNAGLKYSARKLGKGNNKVHIGEK